MKSQHGLCRCLLGSLLFLVVACDGGGNDDAPRQSICGNGAIEGEERCETGLQLPCETETGYAGAGDCRSDCSGVVNCESEEYCGDGIRNGEEACDSGPGCSGDCALGGDGVLRVGAAERIITPALPETYTDVNGDHDWQGQLTNPAGGGPNEPFDDANSNGFFDAIWLGGHHMSRPAQTVHDDIYANAMVFDWNGTRVAMVGIDAIGLFYDDTLAIEAAEGYADLDIDLLLLGASHSHETPDTLGIYGPTEGASGVVPEYVERVRSRTLEALVEATGRLEPAVMETGMTHTGLETYQYDGRDPQIIDDALSVLRFRSSEDHHVLATLLNWASHPEQQIRESAITADFPGVWRDLQKAAHPGQIAVFFNGALGGQIGSNDAVFEWKGTVYDERGYDKIAALGDMLNEYTEATLEGATPQTSPELSFEAREILLPVDNTGFKLMFSLGVFDREIFNEDGTPYTGQVLIGSEFWVKTRVAQLRIGDAQMLTLPGELHPELGIGGFDGEFTPGGLANLWSADNPFPDDLAEAPEGPYLRELMTQPITFMLGLTPDELGYIVPPFNFHLDETNPWIDEACCNDHHYEETNSLGPQFMDILFQSHREMAGLAAPPAVE